MADTTVKFKYVGEQVNYDNGSKDAGTLYFIADSKRIYRGAELFSKPFITVTSYPSTGVKDTFYFNSTDNSVKYYVSTSKPDTYVVYPVAKSVTSNSTDSEIPTAKAVQSAIDAALNGMGGEILEPVETTTALKGKTGMIDGDTCLVKESGTLFKYVADSTKTENGTDVIAPTSGSGRWIAMMTATTYNFIAPIAETSDGIALQYNDEEFQVSNEKLQVLNVGADKIKIQVGGVNTDLQSDYPNKISVPASATSGDIAVFNSNKYVEDTGLKAGGETLASSPNDKTLATEQAVSAAITSALTWS